jgi:hypothetical protein
MGITVNARDFAIFCAMSAACACLCVCSHAGEDDVPENEKHAVETCIAYCRAQEIYRRTDFDRDHVLEYAQVLHGGRKAAPPLDEATLPKPSGEEKKAIADLIAKFGSDQFDVREGTSVSLEAFGPKALQQLKQAAASDPDPEVMQRTGKLAEKIVQNLMPKLNTDKMYGLYSSGREGFVPGDIRLIEKDFAAAECQVGADTKEIAPMNGYLFRVLTRQGEGAAGGARNYIVEGGHMTLGYALLAFPKDYGKTGKRVFIINNQATMFQRDFGTREAMDAYITACDIFDPGTGWSPP